MKEELKVLDVYYDYFKADPMPGLDSTIQFGWRKSKIKRFFNGNGVVVEDKNVLIGMKKGDTVIEHVGVMKGLQKEVSELKGVVNAWMSYSAGKNEIKIYAGKENLVKVGDVLKYESGYYKVTAFKDGRIITFTPNLLVGTSDGSEIEVYSTVKTRTETKKILLSYNTKTVKDPNEWEDYRFQTPGENGYYFEEWEVKEYPDGRTERTKLRTYGRVELKDSVITVGTKPATWTKDNVWYRTIGVSRKTVYSKDKPYSTPNTTTSGTQGRVKITETTSYYKERQTGVTTKEDTITQMVPEVTTVYIGEKLDGGFVKDNQYLIDKGFTLANRKLYQSTHKVSEPMTHYYYVVNGTRVPVGSSNVYDYINVLTSTTSNGQVNFTFVQKDSSYLSRYTITIPENEAENFVKSFYELRVLVSTTEEKEKVAIKPKTKTVADSSKYEDYTHTKPGVDGYYYKIYEIRKYSDDTTEKVFIKNSEVIEEAKPTIITKGTKPIHTTDYRYEEKLSDKIAEETQKDSNLYTDEKRVIDGVPDTLRLTYRRHYEKGVFKREEFVKSEVIKPGKPKITKIGTKPIYSTDYRYEEKPAETIEEKIVEDESIYVGKEEVIKGTPDTLKLTYLRHYKKGVFTHEELVDTKVIKKGKPTIIKKGTKKYPYLWRRLKVIRTNGKVEYTGHELVNSHTKDIQKLDSYFKGYQELTDKEFKRTLEKIENQNSIIDGKFSETRTSINELKETSESAIRNITSTVENKLSGYTSDINTRFEQMNNKFGLYVTESTYNKDKSSYKSKFSSIEQKANRIELSIAGKTDRNDVKKIFTSLELSDDQIKSVTDKFTIESRSGVYRNEMKNGEYIGYKNNVRTFNIHGSGMTIYDDNGNPRAEYGMNYWVDSDISNHRVAHLRGTMTLSYMNSEKTAYHPYMVFDKYRYSPVFDRNYIYTISVGEPIQFRNHMVIDKGYDFGIGRGTNLGIKHRNLSFDYGDGIFIGNVSSGDGIGISRDGSIYHVKKNSWTKKWDINS